MDAVNQRGLETFQRNLDLPHDVVIGTVVHFRGNEPPRVFEHLPPFLPNRLCRICVMFLTS